MATIETEITIICAECGVELREVTAGGLLSGGTEVHVEPCETCLRAAKESEEAKDHKEG